MNRIFRFFLTKIALCVNIGLAAPISYADINHSPTVEQQSSLIIISVFILVVLSSIF